MTDNEIIKALEWCGTHDHCNTGKCPAHRDMRGDDDCMTSLIKSALDLINRQKAEIERLTEENTAIKETLEHHINISLKSLLELRDKLANAKSEAIKEFAERLKEKADGGFWQEHSYVSTDDIDNLVTEMIGDK